MKHIIILMDGMADHALDILDHKTPMMVAQMTGLEDLCQKSQVGHVQTIPKGMNPSSDVANLGLLGYAPEKYHKGRGSFEALNLGVDLKEDQGVMRCNFISLSDHENFGDKEILDHSGGGLTDKEGKQLMHDLSCYLQPPGGTYILNKGYKHLLLLDQGVWLDNKGPHDILNVAIRFHSLEAAWMAYYAKAYEFLSAHPINRRRLDKKLRPANGVWFWGAGHAASLEAFDDMHKKKSVMIASADLILGLGKSAQMATIDVKSGQVFDKTQACIDAIKEDYDFIYLHLEDADDASHEGNLQKKIDALEDFDDDLLVPLVAYLNRQHMAYKLMVLPDHATPVDLRTHTCDAVPYLIYNSEKACKGPEVFKEKMTHAGAINFDSGQALLTYFLGQ